MNSYSHGLGVFLSVIALVALVIQSVGYPWHVVGFSIYWATLVLLYLASTIYHGIPASPRGEQILQRLDHSAIFLLIAGTYTPVCLVTLRGPWGWSILGVVWGLALGGVALKVFARQTPPWMTAGLSLVMGWIAVVAVVPLVRAVPPTGIAWLAIGGILYTIGAVIYATKRPDPLPQLVGSHGVFHMFVLAASASHFIFMLRYVAPVS